MRDFVPQKLQDSEEGYLNMTYWEIHPLFLLVQTGQTEELKKSLTIRLDSFPAGRITRDARKQLEYLTVSLVNTFMIAAIEGGVYPPEANETADRALRALSQVRSVSDIPAIISAAAIRLCEQTAQTQAKSTGNPHVEKARHYIATHLTQEIRTEDIARAVNISPYHLSRLFKAHTGQTMREYLNRERIEAAKQLLAVSDRSIPQIASLLRFCDQSYFTLVFRQQTGVTPGQYRESIIR